jgi:hypothetical protein
MAMAAGSVVPRGGLGFGQGEEADDTGVFGRRTPAGWVQGRQHKVEMHAEERRCDWKMVTGQIAIITFSIVSLDLTLGYLDFGYV